MIIYLKDYRPHTTAWRRYHVAATDRQGQPLALSYRALSAHSARLRALRDGAHRVQAVEEVR